MKVNDVYKVVRFCENRRNPWKTSKNRSQSTRSVFNPKSEVNYILLGWAGDESLVASLEEGSQRNHFSTPINCRHLPRVSQISQNFNKNNFALPERIQLN